MPSVVSVDLLVDLHGAELGGEGGPRPPGHDHGRHHGAHLARHPDPDQVGDVDLRPELPQLHGADVGEDHAHQEADQAHDGQRLRADFLQDEHQIGAPVARAADREARQRDDRLSDEAECRGAATHHVDGRRADACQP
jgi:hypothetical protein